jgi:hypothetical protein
MEQSAGGRDPEERLERSAEELDYRLHQLDDHIHDAEEKAQARRDEAEASQTVAGDWEETGPDPPDPPGPPFGEDPKGAVDEP